MPVKHRTPAQRDERQAQLEVYHSLVREGAPCPGCGAPRNVRCIGARKRNHLQRQELFERWCREQAEAERLDVMMGRTRRSG